MSVEPTAGDVAAEHPEPWPAFDLRPLLRA